MQTHLVNSQMLSRKDVRVWVWDGTMEISGSCKAVAENGVLFHAEVRGAPDFPGLKKSLPGRKLKIELSSPKIKREVQVSVREVALVSAAKKVLSIIATFAEPVEPAFLRVLLEPSVTIVPKKT